VTTSSSKVRVRFAPSPTGHLHVGSVRATIFNWLFARHHGGKYLVRIEDTDVLRSKPEYVASILSSLEWLGLMPDETLVYQMARQSDHIKAANALLEQGRAYRCFCAPRDAEEQIKNLEEGIASKYDGTCRDKVFTAEELEKPHAIRFKLPESDAAILFCDLIRGDISFEKDQFDDFVIVRKDGVPTYNFCVVVDDIFMRISHIIRGEDHISNTPKQILLYNALDATPPQFAHLPLILGPSGARLSKRDGSVSVTEYKEQGFLPQALINYLVRLGWSHGDQELFSREELVKFFSLDQVGKKGSVFDIKKLEWVNGQYLRALTSEQLLQEIIALDVAVAAQLQVAWPEKVLLRLLELYKERSVRLTQLAQDVLQLKQAPSLENLEVLALCKNEQTITILTSFIQKLAVLEQNDLEVPPDVLQAFAKEFCTELGIKMVMLAPPLRIALTGATTSPGVFELISLISIKESILRIEKIIKALSV
jgi:glutamyl-tRNA synthetase